jgi:hypothetical protein
MRFQNEHGSMKRDTISILTAAFCAMSSFTFLRAESDATILFDYPDAVLTLDNQGFEYSEPDSISTPPGNQIISLYLPPRENQWLPPIVKRPFQLAGNDTLIINPENVFYLHVTTSPEGAIASLRGYPVGKTPIALSILRHQDKTLRLEKDGYRSVEINLKELTKHSNRLTMSLDPSQSREMSPSLPVRIEEVNGHVSGWLPFVTLSYFVTSTSFGFYYKGRADDFYEEYLRTSSLERMNQLFDRSEVLDNRARIFWITGQVALGATIYLFVRNYRSRLIARPLPALNFGLTEESRGNIYLTMSFGDPGW